METAPNGARFTLDRLGWAEFEQVCDGLLAGFGLTGLSWEGHADTGRWAVAEDVPTALSGAASEGVVLVVVAQLSRRRGLEVGVPAEVLLAERLADAGAGTTGAATVAVTDVPIDRAQLDGALGLVTVVDGPRLEALLAAATSICLRCPVLLAIREPDPEHSGTWDAEAARSLAGVFAPTLSYHAAVEALERHSFAVLTGPPEMGKTAIARMIGLALQAEGWEVHECTRPEEVWAARNRAARQLFVADDAFGSTEYDPAAAERWANDLDRLLQSMDERHRLIWTSRPAPLRAALGRIHREHGVERFPRPAEVQVDAAVLDPEERAVILLRHARDAGLTRGQRQAIRRNAVAIVCHEHFTPERIRRFVTTRLAGIEADAGPTVLGWAIEAELAEPTAAMAASFDALAPEYRTVLLALVDSPPGPVSERTLASAVRRHSAAGLARPIHELVDRLADHFLRVVVPTSVTWVHPSWRDLVIDRTAAVEADRRAFLSCCGIDGVLLALSLGGGPGGLRSLPLLPDATDWDLLADRLHALVPELDDQSLGRLLATLEEWLHHRPVPQQDELDHLTRVVLGRIAEVWRSGRTVASRPLLRRWYLIAGGVGEVEALPRDLQVWEPGPTLAPARDEGRSHSSGLPAAWREVDRTADIVGRILADL